MERRVDAMSEDGEFVSPPRNPVKPPADAAGACPGFPGGRLLAGFDAFGDAAARGGATLGFGGGATLGFGGGGAAMVSGGVKPEFCVLACRGGEVGAGGSGMPGIGIAADSAGDGGVPSPPLRARDGGGFIVERLLADARDGGLAGARGVGAGGAAIRASSLVRDAGSSIVIASADTVTLRSLNARKSDVSGFDDSSSRVSASRMSRSTTRYPRSPDRSRMSAIS